MSVTPAEIEARKQFEAWWVAEYESHTYQHADAHNMAWEGWKASRRAALEEAMMLAEHMGRGDVAAKLRALAQGGE